VNCLLVTFAQAAETEKQRRLRILDSAMTVAKFTFLEFIEVQTKLKLKSALTRLYNH
jgi:hypothetical protein